MKNLQQYAAVIRTVWLSLLLTLCVGATTVAAAADSNVATAQRQLNTLGYDAGEVDGQMGPNTRDAIKDFQEDNELRRTGRLDTATKAKLTEKVEIQRQRDIAKRRDRDRNRNRGSRRGYAGLSYRYFSIGLGTGEVDGEGGGTADSNVIFETSGGFTPFRFNRNIFMRTHFHVADYEDNSDNVDVDLAIVRLGFDAGYGFMVSNSPRLAVHFGGGGEFVGFDYDERDNDSFSGEDGSGSEFGVVGFAGIRFWPVEKLELNAETKLGLGGARDGLGLQLGGEFHFTRVFGLYLRYTTLAYDVDLDDSGDDVSLDIDEDFVSAGIHLRF